MKDFEKRREAIVDLLAKQGSTTVNYIKHHFRNATDNALETDIRKLEGSGRILSYMITDVGKLGAHGRTIKRKKRVVRLTKKEREGLGL